ncbi:DUF6393 family protein [Pseudomonas quasicaspiana]|uniref:DUF6393 family protein n=1 Tax=Pseudomonas quasicaspiana TaxID=2829821 RepID=UPI001E2F60DE|nr:DUF6393 family protein [Pseudomonas quasicaspiana]MCD5974280.1 hypothetical protein [Pseudomonas quasicaspiana]
MKYPAVAVILLAFSSQHALARSMDCGKPNPIATCKSGSQGQDCAEVSPEWSASSGDRQANLNAMFDEIYASRKPVGFEQIDVSEMVTRFFPLNTHKAALIRAFTPSSTWTIVENLPDRVVVRDNRGQAIVDPDASSVVMTFVFSKESMLSQVSAIRLKSQ